MREKGLDEEEAPPPAEERAICGQKTTRSRLFGPLSGATPTFVHFPIRIRFVRLLQQSSVLSGSAKSTGFGYSPTSTVNSQGKTSQQREIYCCINLSPRARSALRRL